MTEHGGRLERILATEFMEGRNGMAVRASGSELRKTSVLNLTLRGSIRKPKHDIAVKHITPI